MAKFDALKILGDTFGQLIKFLDEAYREGWLLYLIAGIIILVVFVVFF